MADFGKLILGLGLVLVVVGGLLVLSGRMNLPVGRLPGDFSWQNRSGNTRVYFPFATSILLSIVLTLILWAINHFRR